MPAAAAIATDRAARPWSADGAGLQRSHGAARLSLRRRGAETAVADCYQEAALRIRFPRVGLGRPLEAVVINTAGGITGGDRFVLAVEAQAGIRAVVTTQAAEKVYRSAGGIGAFATTMRLGGGAGLDWLPQETILFDGAALDRRLDVTMAEDACFLGVESVVFGRRARGETVAAGHLFDRWRIRRGGRLVYAEALRFDGAVAEALDRPAAGGGAAAAASLVLAAPASEAGLDPARAVIEAAGPGVEGGASAFEGLLVARLLSADPFALRRALTALIETLRGPLPRVWMC